MKTDLFQFCGHCWVFQICWHIECSTFTASSFRIWNNSTGLPSPPVALFFVMLPKAHLISHSRMSGSRWVITIMIIWVMKIFFVQFFCVFLPPLLNIFCFCQWYHPTISSSVVPFSSSLQSFPASVSFPVSQFFVSCGQSPGVSASPSVLPMNIQGLISFRLDWLDLRTVQGTLKSLLQHHSLKASILWGSAFFKDQHNKIIFY